MAPLRTPVSSKRFISLEHENVINLSIWQSGIGNTLQCLTRLDLGGVPASDAGVARARSPVLSPVPHAARMCNTSACSILTACWRRLLSRIYITRNVASFLFNLARSVCFSVRAASDKSHVITTAVMPAILLIHGNKHTCTSSTICIQFIKQAVLVLF
jgi:hypothetical protein